MKYKATVTFNTKTPNKNGVIYSEQALKNAWENSHFKEMNLNKNIPVYDDPESIVKGADEHIVGLACVTDISDDGSTLSLDIEAKKELDEMFLNPCGINNKLAHDNKSHGVIAKDYRLSGFLVSETTSLTPAPVLKRCKK